MNHDNQFFANIVWFGKRYFKLKTKESFSQRKLMKALEYSNSGASYISWKNGSTPSSKRLDVICQKMIQIISKNDLIVIELTPIVLQKVPLAIIIENERGTIIKQTMNALDKDPLTLYEKHSIALRRIIKSRSDLNEYSEMINVFEKILLQRILNTSHQSSIKAGIESIKNIMLFWIKQDL